MHSPLKDPRTRYPGQSLSEQIRDISEDQSSELVVPFMLMLVVAFAWGKQGTLLPNFQIRLGLQKI